MKKERTYKKEQRKAIQIDRFKQLWRSPLILRPITNTPNTPTVDILHCSIGKD